MTNQQPDDSPDAPDPSEQSRNRITRLSNSSELNKPHQPEQPLSVLILKGVLLIVGAFLSASVILQLHYPSGH